jgi:V/A-type H+-transporting ATPase subunit A
VPVRGTTVAEPQEERHRVLDVDLQIAETAAGGKHQIGLAEDPHEQVEQVNLGEQNTTAEVSACGVSSAVVLVGVVVGEVFALDAFGREQPPELAAFYERAAAVTTLGGREGSVTILGAVSPPGGDMSEPVSAHTRRFVRSCWSLDRDLAYARHYPAVSWRDSWSRDTEALADWHFLQRDRAWVERREAALGLLAEADRLESIAQLVGVASLPDRERVVLASARLLREGVLQQSALGDNDAFCAPAKQAALLDLVLAVHERCLALVDRGVLAEQIDQVDLSAVVRARDDTPPDGAAEVAALRDRVLALLVEPA